MYCNCVQYTNLLCIYSTLLYQYNKYYIVQYFTICTIFTTSTVGAAGPLVLESGSPVIFFIAPHPIPLLLPCK